MYKSIHGNQVVFKYITKDVSEVKSHWDRSDPYSEPHESWMMNLRDPDVVQNIAEHIEPPKVFSENEDVAFNEDELRWLYGYAFSSCLNVRHNANGTIFISGNLHKIASKFLDKLEKILPGCSNSPSVAGNFLITPSQYGLHTDSTRQSDWESSFDKIPRDHPNRKYVPWRNILIPMWIGNLPQTVSHAVFFNQRHIDFAHVYLNGNPFGKETATTYPVVFDHGDINFHDNEGKLIPKVKSRYPYDKEHWKEYLEYTPYKRLEGLTPELTCEWVPGCPFVFDAFQLHATNKGTKIKERFKVQPLDENGNPTAGMFNRTEREVWDVKMGLLLTFLREVK
jgi:hypothetical protein